MLTLLSSLARRHLGPGLKRSAKRIIDPLTAPIGSVKGARSQTNKVALTFDDGPDPDVTPRLLTLLHDRGVRATFFLLSEKAVSQAGLVRSIVAGGHEIGLHYDRHDRPTSIPLKEFKTRLQLSRAQLEGLTGAVRLFRPPFGAQNMGTFLSARREGLDVVVWGPYARDWDEQSPEDAAANVLGTVVGGDIVLLHDGLEKPPNEPLPTFDRVRMVELILDGLKTRGLQTETVGGLIATHGAHRSVWFRD